MNITTFINRFFGRDEAETSKSMAKERLRLVLVHDRLDISEQVMDSLRVELLAVIGKYFGIDEQALEVSLCRESAGMALVANIPIRRQYAAPSPPPESPAAAEPPPRRPAAEQGAFLDFGEAAATLKQEPALKKAGREKKQ